MISPTTSLRLALAVAALASSQLLPAPAHAAELFLYRDPDGGAHLVDRPPRPAPPAAERGFGPRPDVLRYEPPPPSGIPRAVGTRRAIRVEDPRATGFRAVQDPGAGPAWPAR